MTADLKPCPFCGGPAKRSQGIDTPSGCPKCDVWFNGPRSARSWNRRAPLPTDTSPPTCRVCGRVVFRRYLPFFKGGNDAPPGWMHHDDGTDLCGPSPLPAYLRAQVLAICAQVEREYWDHGNVGTVPLREMARDLAARLAPNPDGECAECLAGIESGDGHNEGCSQRTAPERDAPAVETLKQLEFGIYRLMGGREGSMCGICCRFAREGHEADCWLGKKMARLAADAKGGK